MWKMLKNFAGNRMSNDEFEDVCGEVFKMKIIFIFSLVDPKKVREESGLRTKTRKRMLKAYRKRTLFEKLVEIDLFGRKQNLKEFF